MPRVLQNPRGAVGTDANPIIFDIGAGERPEAHAEELIEIEIERYVKPFIECFDALKPVEFPLFGTRSDPLAQIRITTNDIEARLVNHHAIRFDAARLTCLPHRLVLGLKHSMFANAAMNRLQHPFLIGVRLGGQAVHAQQPPIFEIMFADRLGESLLDTLPERFDTFPKHGAGERVEQVATERKGHEFGRRDLHLMRSLAVFTQEPYDALAHLVGPYVVAGRLQCLQVSANRAYTE